MSAHEKGVTGEVETGVSGRNEDNSVRFSPDLLDEKIMASLNPLHVQISAFREMMDRLIQVNSARELTTASTANHVINMNRLQRSARKL